ncbi:MAG TPA: 1-deoxy-D-xylulose-5-phosphate synthase [Lentisphaeria bacterium]|nr:MAG: 1-deoxy-D-xylulose-5-phosphate synthase [Lentisphaerae bacterium GWF2_38_69]HBM15744.1 1-deoxy-D-xylulose-5-phosphate synthase [Lentisphaeria bacterium]
MPVLDFINFPADLKQRTVAELETLAIEIRDTILQVTSKNGGHLSSNLGIVELTIALHYAFNTPHDKIIWDVSHQCYAHKILTGRKNLIYTLRQNDGCLGFTSRSESEYDVFGAGHAGTAISAALGIAAARDRLKTDEKVIAVVGDASFSNGLSLEALNNVATCTKNLIIILNDNKMSISGNVGSLTNHLNSLIQKRTYNNFRKYFKKHLLRIPRVGQRIYDLVNRIEDGIKSMIVPGAFFENLGLRYIGPVDGHNIAGLVDTFSKIKEFDTPVLLHILTGKGKGYKPAEMYPDKYHGLGKFDPSTGEVIKKSEQSKSFSEAFGHSAVLLAEKHSNVVAITAAMCSGTGLNQFSRQFPDRFFDVGINEGHGMVFAAGLAVNGLRPIYAVYATFLQRAMSSLYHDICLQNLPVIICADRTGIVDDGPTHHGIYDLSYLRALPNLSIIYPSTENEMNLFLDMAYKAASPVVIKYPKASLIKYPFENNPVEYSWGKSITLKEGKDISIWTTGIEFSTALEVSHILSAHNIDAEIVNCIFIKPFDSDKLISTASTKLIVTVEDNSLIGGLASIVDEILINCKNCGTMHFGWPDKIIPHGTVKGIKSREGITPETIAEKILKKIKSK